MIYNFWNFLLNLDLMVLVNFFFRTKSQFEKEVVSLKTSLDEKTQFAKELDSQNDEQAEQLSYLQDELKFAKSDLESVKAEKWKLESELETLSSEFEELDRKVSELENENRVFKEKESVAASTLAQNSEKLNSLKLEMESAQARLEIANSNVEKLTSEKSEMEEKLIQVPISL